MTNQEKREEAIKHVRALAFRDDLEGWSFHKHTVDIVKTYIFCLVDDDGADARQFYTEMSEAYSGTVV